MTSWQSRVILHFGELKGCVKKSDKKRGMPAGLQRSQVRTIISKDFFTTSNRRIVMCGIAGFLSKVNTEYDREDILENMLRCIEYRGPDEQGEFLDDDIAMGMRRLSIIDLDTGHQPIFNEDKSLVLVCNGEIYNFRELREDLIQKGHKFRTSSDVEVILHLYEDYEEEMIQYIDGMFGFALWDKNNKKLVIGRDRTGIKPVFYYDYNGLFAFGSEIKSILKLPGIDRALYNEAIFDYFSFNYIPAPATIYKRIKKLLPGHYMVVCNDGITIRKYWDLDPGKYAGFKSPEDWAVSIREQFKESVKSHLVSDVPLGVLLSGGIDSTAIAAMMKDLGASVRSFSIGFREKSFNELDYARMAADMFSEKHREKIVEPDAASLMLKLVKHFDEPFADSSALPVYLVSQLAAEDVKVVLSGEGGDEIFAGYMTYEADMLAEKYRLIPGFIRKWIIPGIVNLLPVSTSKVSFDYKARRFIRGADNDLVTRHYMWKVIFDHDEKKSLLSPDLFSKGELADSVEIFRYYFNKYSNERDPLNHILYTDTKVYLPDDLLVKVDRMSMANSLEARVPFLDRKLMELVFGIHSNLKLKGRNKKYILKKALEGIIPDEILYRKKAGFSIPAAKWFKEDLKDFTLEILSPKNIGDTGILNYDYVKQVWDDHQEGRAENSRQLWGLMMFMLWYLNCYRE